DNDGAVSPRHGSTSQYENHTPPKLTDPPNPRRDRASCILPSSTSPGRATSRRMVRWVCFHDSATGLSAPDLALVANRSASIQIAAALSSRRIVADDRSHEASRSALAKDQAD